MTAVHNFGLIFLVLFILRGTIGAPNVACPVAGNPAGAAGCMAQQPTSCVQGAGGSCTSCGSPCNSGNCGSSCGSGSCGSPCNSGSCGSPCNSGSCGSSPMSGATGAVQPAAGAVQGCAESVPVAANAA